jgi:hypothetical protein
VRCSQIYGKGFPESERKSFTNIIYNNIITSMKTLCQQSDQHGAVDPENEGHKRLVDELKGDEEIDEKLGEVLVCVTALAHCLRADQFALARARSL